MHSHPRSVLRRAAIAGVAALTTAAALTFGTGGAAAAPTENAAPSATSSLAEALKRDLGITPEQMEAHSETAARLAELDKALAERFPEAYAGVWMDGEGRGHVGVKNAEGADELRAEAEGKDLATDDARHSSRDLDGQVSELDAWLQTLPAEVRAVVRAAGIDYEGNRLALQLTDDVAGHALPLPDFLTGTLLSYAPAPSVGSLTDYLPNPAAHAPQVVGGDWFISAAPGQPRGAVCSFGFNGTAGGRTVNITAAHCNAGPRVLMDTNHVGDFGTTVHDKWDAAIIHINDANANRFRNNRVGNATGGEAITGTSGVVQGQFACKMGRTTGFSCGRISTPSLNVPVGNRLLQDGFVVNTCALPGDSGGPVFFGGRALGISSASNVAPFAVVGPEVGCAAAYAAQPIFGPANLFVTKIDNVLQATGAKLNT